MLYDNRNLDDICCYSMNSEIVCKLDWESFNIFTNIFLPNIYLQGRYITPNAIDSIKQLIGGFFGLTNIFLHNNQSYILKVYYDTNIQTKEELELIYEITNEKDNILPSSIMVTYGVFLLSKR